MKRFRINGWSILSIVAFCFVLTYNMPFDSNPIGYILILALFVVESIRAYIEGLERGVEIIKEVIESK